MAKILVTGGAGFIGSNFIRYWMKENPEDQVVNLDKITYAGNLENLVDVSKLNNYTFIKGDIGDFTLVHDLCLDVDLIVNFAAESHVDRSIENSADFVKTNIEGTRVLLDVARKRGGIRFHHISTDEVFGSLGANDKPFNETTSYDPRSPYSASKAASDHLVRSYFHTYNLPITISNCSNNYGPYQFPEKLIPLFITNLLEGKKLPIYGRGENIRDWIHVDDHNRGIKLIIDKGKIGETYCLGGGNEISNMSITRNILQLMSFSDDMIDYVPDRLGHDFRYAIDFSKAQRDLSWSPQISFSQGLQGTINWYKKNISWWKNLKHNL